MRKTVALPFAAIALAAVVAAGCSGTAAYNPAANTPTPFPSPTVSCTASLLPAGETVQQVFPQNGLMNQPNVQGVVFAVAPNPLPTNWYIYASSPTFGSTANTSSIAFLATPGPAPGSTAGSTPTPLPTPSDMPSAAIFATSLIYETASIGTFATSTQWTIYLANTNCFPGIQESTFTTNATDLPSPSPSPTST